MNLPTAFVAGIRCFLVTVWCIALAMPYGWHSHHGMMKNYHVGLYKYKVKAGTVGDAVKLTTKLAGQDADGKLHSLLGEGEFWMHEVEEKNCVPFVDKFAVIPGSREYCYMWRRIRIASYILTACIVLGASFTLISVGLSYTTGSEGLVKVSGIIGAAIGSLGLATYFFMTMDFPDPKGSFKLTFGPAFYIAALVGKLLMSAAVALACTNHGSEGEATDDMDVKAALKMAGSHPEQYPPGYGQMSGPPYYQTFSSQPPEVQGSFYPWADAVATANVGLAYSPPSPRPEVPRTASPPPPVNRLSMGGGAMYRAGSPAAQNNWGATVPPAPPSPRLQEAKPGLAKSNPFQ